MSKLLLNGQCRIALQVCAATAMAALLSGCSSDAARLGDPFGNPFSTASNETPVTPRRHVASAGDVIPAGRTPPVSSQALEPRAASASLRSNSSVAFREPISRETTGSIEPGPGRLAGGASAGGWTTAGGTPIQVSEGETADVLAKRYGVPTSSLLQVNGLRSAADVRPGNRITIPVYGPAPSGSRIAAAAPRTIERVEPVIEARPRQVETRVAAVRPQAPAHGRTLAAPTRVATTMPARGSVGSLTRVAAAEGRPIVRQIVTGPNGKPLRSGSVAMKAAMPTRVAQVPVAQVPVAKVPVAKVVPLKTGSIKAAPLKAQQLVAVRSVPVETPRAAEPAPPPVAAAPAAQPVVTADNSPEFRWPARGRIIQSFKGGSGGNDGINIALPEGTSVKAAEGGVVAYAGSELKGYGNLVLIRHPNGFVSAYANNGEIDVKRGETVKRGQQIAKSGQSGNVSSPQLHFELRKGSTPVDPTQFLAGL